MGRKSGAKNKITPLTVDLANLDIDAVPEVEAIQAPAPEAEAAASQPRWLYGGAWLVVLVVSIGSLAVNLDAPAVRPYEAENIAQARFYWLFWDPGMADWNHADWFPRDGYTAPLDHGPVAKYLWGLALKLYGYGSGKPAELCASWSAAASSGSIPADSDDRWALFVARLPGAVCGVLACLAVLAIGRRVAGLVAGLAAAVLLALNPVMQLTSRHILFDTISLCWTLWAVLVLCVFYKWLTDMTPRWGRVIVFAIVEGALIGLAVSTKLTGLLAWTVCLTTLGLGLAGIGLAGIGDRSGRMMALFVSGLCATIVAMTVIYVLNPYLAANPIRNFQRTIEHRFERAHFRADAGARLHPDSVPAEGRGRSREILDRAFSEHATVRAKELGGWQFNAVLCGLGVLVLVVRTLGAMANRRVAMVGVGLVLAGWAFVMVVGYIPSHSPHYYLPMIVAICLTQGVAIGLVPDWLLNKRFEG